jgi:adenylyltransferase/sulfurtransferase
MSFEITVQELQAKQNVGTDWVLLDVREQEEVELVQLPNSVHIPMGDIPSRLHELDPDSEIVVYCHHGVRSLQVVHFLHQHDFEHVVSLAGGIDVWAIEIEPEMTRY